jgi:hypothetical protein
VEVIVRESRAKGHAVYLPVNELAVLLTKIVDKPYVSLAMIERAEEHGVTITKMPMEKKKKIEK